MENLFRFLLIRPAEAAEAQGATVSLKMTTSFQTAIENALALDSPREVVKEVVDTFIDTEKRYIDHPRKLNHYSSLSELRERIERGEIISMEDLRIAIKEIFDQPAENVAASLEFTEDDANCADSIIAIKLAPREHKKPIAGLVRMFQVMALIKRVADNDDLLNEEGKILRSLHASILFPDSYVLSTFVDPQSSGRLVHLEKRDTARLFKEAKTKVKTINKAINELMNLKTTDLALVNIESPLPEQPIMDSDSFSRKPAVMESLEYHGAPIHLKHTEKKMLIIPEAMKRLSDDTKSTLADARIDTSTFTYREVIGTLEVSLVDAMNTLNDLGHAVFGNVIDTAGGSPEYYSGDEYYEDSGPQDLGFFIPFSNLKSIGIGELLLVKQQLVRYQGGDVTHVENILKSEKKFREHRRTKRTEQFYLTETEISTHEEMDLESTERYEIQREAEEAIREEQKLDTGLKITARYGSVLEVEASLDYAYEKVKEKSKKAASDYSKEVINKAVSKVSEKIRERKTMQIIEEYEEKNLHGFDNSDGPNHVIGVYQWVDKVYQAQVFNYGMREMYDLMVPEPGAFLAEALKQNLAHESGLKSPPYFSIMSEELNRINYQYYVWLYNVIGVEPYPQRFITLSKAIHSSGKSEAGTNVSSSGFSMAEDLKIEDGYKAISAHVTVYSEKEGKWTDAWISVGRHMLQFMKFNYDTSSWEYNIFLDCMLDDETENIPISVITPTATMLSVTIEITCECTKRKYHKWQHDTYDLIMQTYLNKKAAVEEKRVAMAIQGGETISGRNQAANRKLEKNELKKVCISLITKQHFDDFNSIELGSNDLPQTNLAEAEKQGRFIRFFEQAFEWENMTFVLYPYYWGRKGGWQDKVKFEDADPLFADFITAGAARVVVPARDAFRSTIRHYLTTGEIWMGGELPDVDSSLYLPISEELKEKLGAPGDESPVDEPWPVVVPTNLVRLRSDDSLPEWIKTDTGEWVPIESIEP